MADHEKTASSRRNSEELDLFTDQQRLNDGELRVLIVTACYFMLDGVSLTIRRLESYLRSKGAIVTIVTTIPENVDRESRKNLISIPGIEIPFTISGASYKLGTGLDENTLQEIEQFNPNIVHFTVPDLAGMDGVTWCKKRGIPFICTWHSNYLDYMKYYFVECWLRPIIYRYLHSFYQHFRLVYVPTPFIKAKLDREEMLPASKVAIWGRGVDLDLFNPSRRSSEFRKRRGYSDTDVVVLWVGRMVAEKRPDIWVNVMEKLFSDPATSENVCGMVVGHGSYESSFSGMSRVSCTGWLSGEALAEAYASCDVLLFPSAVETFGNVTLEAMASGLPAVVEANCSGHLISHGVNGYIVQENDTESWFTYTSTLVKDISLRKQMGLQARSSAHKYDRNIIMQQMIGHYKRAIYDLKHNPFSPDEMVDRRTSPCFFSWACLQAFLAPICHGFAKVMDLMFLLLTWSSSAIVCFPNTLLALGKGLISGQDSVKVSRAYVTGKIGSLVSTVVYYFAIFLAYLIVTMVVLLAIGFQVA